MCDELIYFLGAVISLSFCCSVSKDSLCSLFNSLGLYNRSFVLLATFSSKCAKEFCFLEFDKIYFLANCLGVYSLITTDINAAQTITILFMISLSSSVN